jgi:Na+-driven multidrug efflux pump
MMAAEGPFLAAVIARLPDPKYNLAAHGVAFAFAILIEAPVIMLMSASTALVEDAVSYRKLRNFANALNIGSTAVLLAVLIPPVFDFLMRTLIGLPTEVADLTYGALWLFLPWPAAIGVRRFIQGVLIRSGRTRLVATGTVIRLTAMAATAVLLFLFTDLPGAWLGAASLSAAVITEAIAARWMASGAIRQLLAGPKRPAADGAPLGYRRISHFYFPLLLTSVIGLTVHPMLTFFMVRAPSPVESLAVFPVVHAQDAAIALLGRDNEHFRELALFGAGLGLAATAGLAAVAFTPLADVWFVGISGLSQELADFALTPTRIMVVLPALSVLLSFQRAILMQARVTRPITVATVIEIIGIAILFAIGGWGIGLVGVTAAFLSYVGGRTLSTAYLASRVRRLLRTN